MVQYRITLDKEDNPAFYQLTDGHSLLMKRYNSQNVALRNLRIPRWCPWKARPILKSMANELEDLQKDFLGWHHSAANFLLNPHYTIPEGPKQDVIYLQATDNLRFLVSLLDSRMAMLVQNYNLRLSEYSHRIDFSLALLAFAVSAVGLVLSIVAL